MMKSLLTKKIEDLNFKLKRMGKEENSLQNKVNKANNECQVTQVEFENRQMDFEQLRTEILHKVQEEEEKRNLKDTKLNMILHLQTRARWYRAIKVKRYRASNRDESQGATELTHVLAQNQELKAIINQLTMQFPHLRKNITKAINMLV